jgi:hypothetical protein
MKRLHLENFDEDVICQMCDESCDLFIEDSRVKIICPECKNEVTKNGKLAKNLDNLIEKNKTYVNNDIYLQYYGEIECEIK